MFYNYWKDTIYYCIYCKEEFNNFYIYINHFNKYD